MQIIDLKSRLRILQLQLKRQPGSKLDNPQSPIPIPHSPIPIPIVSAEGCTPSHHANRVWRLCHFAHFAHFQPPQKSMSESGRPFSGSASCGQVEARIHLPSMQTESAIHGCNCSAVPPPCRGRLHHWWKWSKWSKWVERGHSLYMIARSLQQSGNSMRERDTLTQLWISLVGWYLMMIDEALPSTNLGVGIIPLWRDSSRLGTGRSARYFPG